jgi:hypothetical protein
MLRLSILLMLMTWFGAPPSADAQEVRPFARGVNIPQSLSARSVQIPDSVRTKVGYQHWKGGAIGAAVGAAAGLLVAYAAHDRCDDCSSSGPAVSTTTLVGAGIGGVFGLLWGSRHQGTRGCLPRHLVPSRPLVKGPESQVRVGE